MYLPNKPRTLGETPELLADSLSGNLPRVACSRIFRKRSQLAQFERVRPARSEFINLSMKSNAASHSREADVADAV